MPSPFDDEAAARELLERLRWPDGPACPRCDARGPDKTFKIGGEKHSHRHGLYQCKPCRRRQFSVTVGTAFERLRISISTWVRAAHEFSYEGSAPPLLTELGTRIGVSRRTVLRMREVIAQAVGKYRGNKAGFGMWPRSLMKHGGTPKQQRSPLHQAKLLAEKVSTRHSRLASNPRGYLRMSCRTKTPPTTSCLRPHRGASASPTGHAPKSRSAQAPKKAAF